MKASAWLLCAVGVLATSCADDRSDDSAYYAGSGKTIRHVRPDPDRIEVQERESQSRLPVKAVDLRRECEDVLQHLDELLGTVATKEAAKQGNTATKEAAKQGDASKEDVNKRALALCRSGEITPGLVRCFSRAREVMDLEDCAVDRFDPDLARVHARLMRNLPEEGNGAPTADKLIASVQEMLEVNGARAEQVDKVLREALNNGGIK